MESDRVLELLDVVHRMDIKHFADPVERYQLRAKLNLKWAEAREKERDASRRMKRDVDLFFDSLK